MTLLPIIRHAFHTHSSPEKRIYSPSKYTHMYEHLLHVTTVHLAVAGGVFDGVSLCCLFFPRDILDEIWDLIESVSEGVSTYSTRQ